MDYKEWHHAYLGMLLSFLGLLVSFLSLFISNWLLIPGILFFLTGNYLYIDDYYQHWRQKKDPTYQSPLHKLNSILSKKYPIISKLNVWMNKLFGK